jgi:Lung seven transmembrane receptor
MMMMIMFLVVSTISWVVVDAEIIELNLLIDASSDEVHYIRGYLQAPGKIDLSDVKFITSKEPDFLYGDDDDLFRGEDDTFDDEGDDNFLPDIEPEEPPTSETQSPTENMNDVDNSNEERTDLPTEVPVPPPNDPTTDTSNNRNSTSSSAGGDVGDGDGIEEVTTSPPDSSSNPEDESLETMVPTSTTAETENGNLDPSTENPNSGGTTNSTTDGTDGGGDRRLETRILLQDQPTNDNSNSPQIIEIVLFLVPEECRNDVWGVCDWSTLGVGIHDDEMQGGISYCCSQDTADRGLCSVDQVGTLIVDDDKLDGEHRKVSVPSSTEMEFVMNDDDAIFEIQYTGNYVMILANCNDYGMDVIATGDMTWVSVGGYLPGDEFGLMYFYAALACAYIVLALWYYCGMKRYQDAAIQIQKFILATIMLGLLEASFRGLDLYVWNMYGKRSDGVMYAALTLGVLKRGISRCLAVMVAMGWGVVRDSLGRTLCQIVILGLVYSGLTLARDYLVLAAEKVELVNLTEEEELLDLALILTPLIIFVNVVFYFWIITSLNSTTDYLRNMNQSSKLRRHLRLRCLIITSLVIVGVWLIFSIVQVFTNTLTQEWAWVLEAVMHVNYLFILVGVSILWRPNSHAKDYAMQMELSPDADDGNELELSSNVPSAISDDDMDYYDADGNDPDHPDGVKVDRGIAS